MLDPGDSPGPSPPLAFEILAVELARGLPVGDEG